MKLSPDQKLDINEVLKDLDRYRPRRKGWRWRSKLKEHHVGSFIYYDASEDLDHSVPLPAAQAFDDVDPQCDMVITTEVDYNRTRRHSANGYINPEAFEAQRVA